MRRSTFCIGVSKPFGCSKTSVGRHTQKPKPEGLGAVTELLDREKTFLAASTR